MIVELRRWCRAPIIVLSGRTSPGDKIGALDVGADDYVTKPFAMAELLARLRAALRRNEGELAQDQPCQVTIGHWTVDLLSHQVTAAEAGTSMAGTGAPGTPAECRAETLRLTPTEWRILEILLHRPGQLVGSGQILTEVSGPGFQQRTNYLRFHMAGLRGELENNPARPAISHRTRHGLPLPAVNQVTVPSSTGLLPTGRQHSRASAVRGPEEMPQKVKRRTDPPGAEMKALAADDPHVIGEYRLRGRLGQDGMGRVYLGLSPPGRVPRGPARPGNPPARQRVRVLSSTVTGSCPVPGRGVTRDSLRPSCVRL